MADKVRQADVVWTGDLRTGDGTISTESGALADVPYRYATRFEEEPGTNPEELIAAAHAACYSMALASTLAKKQFKPERLDTHSECTLARHGGGHSITRVALRVRAQVEGLDAATFAEIAQEADKRCPVSNLLRPGVEIELEAELL